MKSARRVVAISAAVVDARSHALRGLALAATLALGACSSDPPAPAEAAPTQPQWFCEAAENEQWDCVQSTEVGAPAASASESGNEAVEAAPDDARRADPPDRTDAGAIEPQPAQHERSDSSEPRDAGAEAGELPAEETTATALGALGTSDAPGAPPPAVREEPRMRRIGDLPGDYWAIQIIAVANREQLEAFAAEYDLFRHPAARIDSNGEIRYVLLWDFYETRQQAEAALVTLPEVLRKLGPWLRTLASLQDALGRASASAAAATPE